MRILCAIMGCNTHAQNGYHQVIRDTWGKDLRGWADLAFFVGGYDPLILRSDEIWVDSFDDKDHLMYKVAKICEWAIQNGYDSIFKVNTNTYVNVSLLQQTGHETLDYAGAPVGTLGSLYAHTEAYSFIQGSASWLSSRAAEIVSREAVGFMESHAQKWLKYNGLICPYPHSEDLWIGQVLNPHLPNFHVDEDRRYSNGPLTYWSQSNYIKTQRLVSWMVDLHNAESQIERHRLNKRYQNGEL